MQGLLNIPAFRQNDEVMSKGLAPEFSRRKPTLQSSKFLMRAAQLPVGYSELLDRAERRTKLHVCAPRPKLKS